MPGLHSQLSIQTLGFGSGSNLRVVRWSPTLRSVLSIESAYIPLSLCPFSCALSLSLSKINTSQKKKKEEDIKLNIFIARNGDTLV